MHRTLLFIAAAALTAAAFGLPVGDLAGGLGFAVGLAMVGSHLVSRPEQSARLAPLFVALVVTSIMWDGVAHGVRAIAANLLSSPLVWLGLGVVGVFALLAPPLLAVAHVLPEPEKPAPLRPTTRTRSRVVEPLSSDDAARAEREASEDDFDFFGGGRG